MADIIMILAGAAEALHAEPKALGLEAYQWVSVAMALLIAIFVWKKVPGLVTSGIDARIQAIREQLEEAKALRAEAEALRDEYASKLADAEKHAEAMMANAQRDADAILEKAEAESKLMVDRRKRMAEDKIAAAERDAVAEVKSVAVSAAAKAARKLIAEKHGADADKKLANDLIASI